jgi:hypothetical protein
MKTQELLSSLKKWLSYRKAFQIILNLFEAGVVVFIGISSNQISNEFWYWVLIILCLIYFTILIVKSLDLIHFPNTIVDHLSATIENEELKERLNKVKIQNEIIIETIDTLNNQTCIIESHSIGPDIDSPNRLCDLEISNGLEDFFEPLIKNYYRIFPKATGNFLIAMYLENINEITQNELKENLTGFLILSDSLYLSEKLTANSINDDEANGIELEIQSNVKKSFRNGISFVETIKDKSTSKEYFIICSNISEACNLNAPLGTLVIISDSKEEVFTDTLSLLEILNRIASNWIAKYNECVLNKYQRLQ